MAYSTEFVDEGRGVIHVASGIVTGAEIIEAAVHSLSEMQDGMPLCYSLVDFTAIDKFAVSAEEIKDIARINLAISQISRTFCVAVVAPSNHAFGMARMWEAHVDPTGWDTCVFRSLDEAMAWLAECVGAGIGAGGGWDGTPGA